MGPLFSLSLALIGLTVLAASAFVVARLLRYRFWGAAVLAATFCGGATAGCIAAVLIGAVIIGTNATLTSRAAVLGYLSYLGASALLGGAAATRFVARRSNYRIERPREP